MEDLRSAVPEYLSEYLSRILLDVYNEAGELEDERARAEIRGAVQSLGYGTSLVDIHNLKESKVSASKKGSKAAARASIVPDTLRTGARSVISAMKDRYHGDPSLYVTRDALVAGRYKIVMDGNYNFVKLVDMHDEDVPEEITEGLSVEIQRTGVKYAQPMRAPAYAEASVKRDDDIDYSAFM